MQLKNYSGTGKLSYCCHDKNEFKLKKLARLSQGRWTTTPNNIYHPNQLSTRCVVESFDSWLTVRLCVASRRAGLTSLIIPDTQQLYYIVLPCHRTHANNINNETYFLKIFYYQRSFNDIKRCKSNQRVQRNTMFVPYIV